MITKLQATTARFLTAGIILLAGALRSFAQYTNTSDVLDGSGTRSAGGAYVNVSAAGQPGGIGSSAGGAYLNQAGFLNTFLLKPGSLGAHGIPVELDPDNDGDALSDEIEITGAAFNPTTPTDPNSRSTSGGMSDGEKAIAGVNPLDPNAEFRILSLTNSAGAPRIAWRARGNGERTYVVYSRTSEFASATSVVFSNTVAGGTAPWYVITNGVADAATTNAGFYSVSVQP